MLKTKLVAIAAVPTNPAILPIRLPMKTRMTNENSGRTVARRRRKAGCGMVELPVVSCQLPAFSRSRATVFSAL
jgi:hypothetical protein